MKPVSRSQSVSPDRVGLLEPESDDDQRSTRQSPPCSPSKSSVKPVVLLSLVVAVIAFSLYLIRYTTWGWSTIFGPGAQYPVGPQTHTLLQDLVTWDEHSLLIRGERIMLYSGEFHPYRLPVPGLWLDILQKMKALGFNAVSFYTDW